MMCGAAVFNGLPLVIALMGCKGVDRIGCSHGFSLHPSSNQTNAPIGEIGTNRCTDRCKERIHLSLKAGLEAR